MAEKKRKGGGGKLARTENVQVRLDPKLRFAAELAAGKERRTLSSFVEWAVERAVKEVGVTRNKEGKPVSAAEVTDAVWSGYEADRLVGLATHYPELLTHEEQTIWKAIRQEKTLWKSGSLDISLLRTCWGPIVNSATDDKPVYHRLIEIFAKGTLQERNIIAMVLHNLAQDYIKGDDKYSDSEFPVLTPTEIEEFQRKFPEYSPFVPQLSIKTEESQRKSINKNKKGNDNGT